MRWCPFMLKPHFVNILVDNHSRMIFIAYLVHINSHLSLSFFVEEFNQQDFQSKWYQCCYLDLHMSNSVVLTNPTNQPFNLKVVSLFQILFLGKRSLRSVYFKSFIEFFFLAEIINSHVTWPKPKAILKLKSYPINNNV
ncbi:UNVERIFIED_CONTAM: hypothetical protein RMT77_002447 [Armadillidium vulgare]